MRGTGVRQGLVSISGNLKQVMNEGWLVETWETPSHRPPLDMQCLSLAASSRTGLVLGFVKTVDINMVYLLESRIKPSCLLREWRYMLLYA